MLRTCVRMLNPSLACSQRRTNSLIRIAQRTNCFHCVEVERCVLGAAPSRRQLDRCICLRAQVSRSRPPTPRWPSQVVGPTARCTACDRPGALTRQGVWPERVEDWFYWRLGGRTPYCPYLNDLCEQGLRPCGRGRRRVLPARLLDLSVSSSEPVSLE